SLNKTLAIMFSDLRLGDLNYLVSVYPTAQHQSREGLLLIRKQPSPCLLMAGSIRPMKDGHR
ncbi:MAG: hypothetical protein WCR08_11225, partial [Gammaproteobacteria bacterium]